LIQVQPVKLTAKVKLETTATHLLLRTMEVANECARWIGGQAWQSKTFGKHALQKLTYTDARQRTGLTAQVVIRIIAKVADAYRSAFALHRLRTTKVKRQNKKLAKLGKPLKLLPIMEPVEFHNTGSIAYDDRILRWMLAERAVSIWTLEGRRKISFVGGEHQYALLATRKGESDLIYQGGKFYLAATCDTQEAPMISATEFLGVDLGVANIASDSDGKRHSGSEVKSVRYRHRRLRRNLQKKQTRAAKRRLKRLSGKEARFAKHTNHVISKEIVACAKGTNRGIKLEDLSGIRDRVDTFGRRQRVVLSSWAFHQLALFVAYKARRDGVPVIFVDPRNTSRECFQCGHIAKGNRPNQSTFRCLACTHADNDDTNAARVISGRPACKPGEPIQDRRLSELCGVSHGSVKSPRL
jgi:IS605 OrfB family transposase